VNERLLQLVWEHDEIAELDPASRRLALRSLLAEELGLDDVSRQVSALVEVIDGFGPLSAVMDDELVTDVLVNGPDEVWIERSGELHRWDAGFSGREDLEGYVQRLLGRANARADVSNPIATGRLPDGSRLHVVLPPIAPQGPLLSIRKISRRRFDLADLVVQETISPEDAGRLRALVCSHASILLSGATGTGKTTLLNALLGCIPGNERVVTIEETPELAPACPHWVSLVARDANVEGVGGLDLMTLVRAALRMRPDRVVVGEVRGGEALAALAALSTGHEGSMLTIHARSADDALERMVSLALEASSGASERMLRVNVRRAFAAVGHLERDANGKRRLVALRSLD
jgi:pilus assembly protein CpaF